MSYGHGQLGLATHATVRTFHDLMANPDGERRAYLEIEPGKTVTSVGGASWSAHLGSIYKTAITAASLTIPTSYGVIRPIVAILSGVGTRELTRVESISDMVAGTWFYDDAALVAGGSTDLYVQLSTGADPDTTTIVARLLFGFAGVGEVLPLFGPVKNANPELDSYSGGNPVGLTEVGNGVTLDTSEVLSGTGSTKIGTTTNAAGAFDGFYDEDRGVEGGLYVLAFYYKTPLVGHHTDVEVRVRIGTAAGPVRLTSDGRNLTTSNEGFALPPTWGEWRRAEFYFLWSGATTSALQAGVFIKNTSGVSTRSGWVNVDRWRWYRIYRWVHYEPRLDEAALPETEVRSADNLFGALSYGIGGVKLSDGDGELAKAFAGLHLFHKPATVYWGGRLPNGAEVHRDEWRGGFPGLTRRPEVTDGAIRFELDDARTLAEAVANSGALRVADLADLDEAAEGLPKDLVFGQTEGPNRINPVRVALNSDGYGKYRYLDEEWPVADGVDVDVPAGARITVYPNQDLANRDLLGWPITDFTNDIGLSANKTLWEVKRDIRNYGRDRAGNDVGSKNVFSFGVGSFTVVTGVNDKINVKTPAGLPQTITLTAGNYTGTSLAAHVEAQLDANGSLGDFSVSYSLTTGKFTITYNGGGNIHFLTGTGANVATDALRLLMGFVKVNRRVTDAAAADVIVEATFADHEDATTYTASNPVFAVIVYTAPVDLEGPAYEVAADVQAAMRTALGANDITCTYNETTHKFTIAYTGSQLIFMLLMKVNTASAQTDADVVAEAPQKESYKLLGYDTRTDKTGATSYVGDVATFTDPDQDHVIRIRSGGYRDDAAGSICGTANAAINTGPAIISWLLQKRLRQAALKVDVTSFAEGRTFAQAAFLLLFKIIRAGAVLRALPELAQAAVGTLVVDGEGIWRWVQHVASSSGAREFTDRDYLSWRMWLDERMVYRAVRVYADWNGSLNRSMTYGDGAGVIDTAIPIKHGAEGILEIQADLERQYVTGGTQLLGNHYSRLVGKIPRCVEFSARGRLTDLLVGQKVKLTRSRAFDTTGAISSLAFRITGLRHNYLTGISTCQAVEDVVFLT